MGLKIEHHLASKISEMQKLLQNLLKNLTLVAQTKHVVTTLDITSMRFLVSWITLSTFVNVAALPTVGFFTVN